MSGRNSEIWYSETMLRVGAVSYLNSKPLIEGFESCAPEAELVLDFPSRLADDLALGTLDVALIPSVEAFGRPDYEVVSDACVATHGPVLSVKLYSRVHPGDIQTLALDEGSRTSAALVRVMLAERFGVTPQLVPFPLGQGVSDSNADAILSIGDRAIQAPAEKFHTVWDLGEEWLRWTGLPFVFAMWVTRKDVDLGDVELAIGQARDLGLQRLPAIARREAPKLGISFEQALDYLEKNLHFRIGSAERHSLELFRELVVEQGIAPPGELVFRPVPTAARPKSLVACES
ncbi:MAG: menaquinone biosynthesis protein [Planctomycetaceae bacterium]|nr:menaquinone biosynthesis protein [Planctomycetaceae bacterium]